MRRLTLPAVSLFTFAILAKAQDSPTSPASPSAPQSQADARDRAQVDAALKRYESAYQHMSLYELQIVWPDLPNQKKEYRKAEDLFKSGDVSDIQVSLEAKDMQVNGDDALVHAIQHEQYLKNDKSEYYGGDNRMEAAGTRTPGPVAVRKKREVKKTDDVTVHLHRQGSTWVIASLEETGKHH